ncbi:YceI family protein [Pinibacter soli]|uniref:YceI family protein n=1 Tax=Pinibacter soli TaxID=3044211 RepID=A0ABT6RI37_9BACT|nr:YceI family protein [Pinibacter soli]MDI3322237.1 YceI family protein [Pinibacter soli]
MKGYKFLAALLIAIFICSFSYAQQYAPEASGSKIGFGIKNLGVTVHGTFSGLEGEITFDPNQSSKSSFNVHVDSKSINTDNDMRDNHLRKEEFFNVEKYPHLTFVSESITGSGKSFNVKGKLTIKGVTKEVSFKFTATPQGDIYTFKGSFELNRRDFEVGGSSITMSDKVNVELIVVAKKK